MQATIEIDDNLIPDWADVIAFRCPSPGEWFINTSGGTVDIAGTSCANGPQLILRRKWQWPSWLTCRAIAKDSDGTWYGYGADPKWDGRQWLFNDTHCGDGYWSNAFRSGFVDLSQFPDCEPEDSLRINPNWKE